MNRLLGSSGVWCDPPPVGRRSRWSSLAEPSEQLSQTASIRVVDVSCEGSKGGEGFDGSLVLGASMGEIVSVYGLV